MLARTFTELSPARELNDALPLGFWTEFGAAVVGTADVCVALGGITDVCVALDGITDVCVALGGTTDVCVAVDFCIFCEIAVGILLADDLCFFEDDDEEDDCDDGGDDDDNEEDNDVVFECLIIFWDTISVGLFEFRFELLLADEDFFSDELFCDGFWLSPDGELFCDDDALDDVFCDGFCLSDTDNVLAADDALSADEVLPDVVSFDDAWAKGFW